jgi:hypothetical protein
MTGVRNGPHLESHLPPERRPLTYCLSVDLPSRLGNFLGPSLYCFFTLYV